MSPIEKVLHLYRRAAFGSSPSEWEVFKQHLPNLEEVVNTLFEKSQAQVPLAQIDTSFTQQPRAVRTTEQREKFHRLSVSDDLA